jgi:hypothetical protein
MLPEPDDSPAENAEFTEVTLIAYTVGVQFVSPERRELVLPSRQPPSVPEITVDEHGHLLLDEDDIWTTWQVLNVAFEPQTASPQFSLH